MITHIHLKKKKNKKTMSDLFAGLCIMYARRVDLYGDDMTHDETIERERTTVGVWSSSSSTYCVYHVKKRRKLHKRERTTNVKNHFLWDNGQGHPRGLCRYICCCCSRNDSTAFWVFGFVAGVAVIVNFTFFI